MVDGSYDLILGCAELSQLRSFDKRYDYIPILFVGYDSVVEDMGHSRSVFWESGPPE